MQKYFHESKNPKHRFNRIILFLRGLANLFARLTIVRKIDACDGSYPSVNTCIHDSKLPDYTSKKVMSEKLIMATKDKRFH